MAKENKTMSAEEKKWQAEDDLRALVRAKEIMSDKARHKAATDLARDQLKATKQVITDKG